MWHPIENVANHYNLDEQKLADFAMENHDKYGIVSEISTKTRAIFVNTWNVDKLVADFIAQNTVKVSEIDNVNFKLYVMKKHNEMFDVIVDGVVRHPNCDNEAVIRALTHYLDSFSYKLSKTEKAH